MPTSTSSAPPKPARMAWSPLKHCKNKETYRYDNKDVYICSRKQAAAAQAKLSLRQAQQSAPNRAEPKFVRLVCA
jgi:hypothetical protein